MRYLHKGDRRRRPFYIQQKCTGACRDGHSSHFSVSAAG